MDGWSSIGNYRLASGDKNETSGDYLNDAYFGQVGVRTSIATSLFEWLSSR